MGLPRGTVIPYGYATVDKDLGGLDYRRIASKMTDMGFSMNHAGARQVFLGAMIAIASKICQEYDLSLTSEQVESLARRPQFQMAIAQVVHNLHEEQK